MTQSNSSEPPTSTSSLHKHLTLVQWLMIVSAVVGAAGTFLLPFSDKYTWVSPTLMILGLVGVVVGAALKVLNGGWGITPLIIVSVLALTLVACTTPRQILVRDTVLFVAADAGATAAVRTGKVPASEVPTVKEALNTLAEKLTALRKWVADNPNLANVPGMTPPELTAEAAAMQIAAEYVARYSLLVPLPALTPPPTTVPAPQ